MSEKIENKDKAERIRVKTGNAESKGNAKSKGSTESKENVKTQGNTESKENMESKEKETAESRKTAENAEQKKEKVLTKYDLKVQKRAAERRRARKEELVGRITGIVIVAALFCLVASFPVRTYLAVHGTYVKVGGEKVSRVEFDYNYNMVKNNYIAQNGYYMSMFGIDLSGDLSGQMYSQTLSWQDYFEQKAIENIANNKALKAQARAAGFVYDDSADYAEYEQSLKAAAAAAGKTEKEYLQELYGPLATASRVKPYVKDTLLTDAYFAAVSEEKTPGEEEIRSYYNENKDSYDSVDYRMFTVSAELPTEPTDLADPAEKTEGTEGAGDADAAYQPSEAEIEFAMEQARKEAVKKQETVAAEGDLTESASMSGTNSLYRDWLFAEERKPGDTTIIENESRHLYYVLAFEKRYLDETPTVDVRVIVCDQEGDKGQALLDEWKGGDATEESFSEMADKYNDPSILPVQGGLMEGLSKSGMMEEMADWVYDGKRVKGDTALITPEGEAYAYVVYYLGVNDPVWKQNVKNTLLTEAMAQYVTEIARDYTVQDSWGRLNYLKVKAQEEASGNNESAQEDGGSAESGSEEDGGSAQADSAESGGSAD